MKTEPRTLSTCSPASSANRVDAGRPPCRYGSEAPGFLIDPATSEAALRRPLLILEPGQGLARVAPEQPIVLSGTRIEYGQWHGHASACAASLLLLHGLALLASLFIFFVHATPPLVLRWATPLSTKVHSSFLRAGIP